MARLEFEITGNASGLNNVVNSSLGILGRLKQTADDLKIDLFKANTVQDINNIGVVLTGINGRITELTNNALRNNQVFKDQQVLAVMDTLASKLAVATGNATLFGASIKTQKNEVAAYQSAINSLLSSGFDPFDERVQRLKRSVDSLNASIAQQTATAAMNAQYAQTSGLVARVEAQIRNLKTSISGATDERSLGRYNDRLRDAQKELARLNAVGQGVGQTNSLFALAEKKVNDLKIALRGATTETGIASYNRQLVVAQAELTRLRALGLSAAGAQRQLGAGFNTVGLELGRVIQDAPYAANNFGAIGNNITRLVEVLPGYISATRATIVANGGATTSTNVLKTALGGIFSGWGALTLIISAAVTAYTIYSMRAKKATADTKSLEESLRGLAKAQLDGAKGAVAEQTRLDILMNTYRNANLSVQERKTAYAQLNQIYPETFKNFSTEAQALKDASRYYDILSASISANARARAAENVLIKNAERRIENLVLERKASEAVLKIQRQQALVSKERDAAMASGSNGGEIVAIGKSQSIDTRLVAAQKKVNDIATDNKLLAQQDKDVQDLLAKAIKDGGTQIDLNHNKIKATNATLVKQLSIEEQLRAIRQKTEASASLSGKDGYEADRQKVLNSYIDLQGDLASISKKINADSKMSASDKAKNLSAVADLSSLALSNKTKELADLEIGEAQRVSNEIARINSTAGVQIEELKSKEIAAINKRYDAEVTKAGHTDEILRALAVARATELSNVDSKYLAKEQDLQDKINAIQDKANAATGTTPEKATAKITAEWENVRKAAFDAFEIIKKIINADTSLTPEQKTAKIGGLETQQSDINKGITAAIKVEVNRKDTDKISKELTDQLKRATTSFANNMYSTLTTLNQQADQSFRGIFSTLVQGLNSAMEQVFLDIAQKQLSSALEKGVSEGTKGLGGKMSKEMQMAVAGAGILGSIISGATKKTSSLGQGAGGALQGAATGAMIGSVIPGIGTAIGAVAGGLAGLVSGLFGASKARKEAAKIAADQLAEAKRQTELLRSQALSYTSSIVGRMTENGVITQVDVNEFGQLIAKVSGKDLQFVLDRNSQSR